MAVLPLGPRSPARLAGAAGLQRRLPILLLLVLLLLLLLLQWRRRWRWSPCCCSCYGAELLGCRCCHPAAQVDSIQSSEAIIAVVDAIDRPKEALTMFQPGP